MAPHELSGSAQPKRARSPLAIKLTEAFAPFEEWSEVRVVRDDLGHRTKVVALPTRRGQGGPYDWAQAA